MRWGLLIRSESHTFEEVLSDSELTPAQRPLLHFENRSCQMVGGRRASGELLLKRAKKNTTQESARVRTPKGDSGGSQSKGFTKGRARDAQGHLRGEGGRRLCDRRAPHRAAD